MTEVSQIAQTNEHYPLWSNLLNEVDVTLNTHDQQCLSTFDILLAEAMDVIDALQKAESESPKEH